MTIITIVITVVLLVIIWMMIIIHGMPPPAPPPFLVDDDEEQEKKETPSEEIVSENVISAEAAAASTLALYKDVINDFLGVINFPKFNQEHGQQLSKLEDDERRPDFWDSLREAEEVGEEEEEEKGEERFQSEEVSQYSYGSFLSEVYRVTLERMKQRVKI